MSATEDEAKSFFDQAGVTKVIAAMDELLQRDERKRACQQVAVVGQLDVAAATAQSIGGLTRKGFLEIAGVRWDAMKKATDLTISLRQLVAGIGNAVDDVLAKKDAPTPAPEVPLPTPEDVPATTPPEPMPETPAQETTP